MALRHPRAAVPRFYRLSGDSDGVIDPNPIGPLGSRPSDIRKRIWQVADLKTLGAEASLAASPKPAAF